MELNKYYITWDSSKDDDPVFLKNSIEINEENIDFSQQNLNVLLIKRKLSLDKVITDLMASLGIVVSSPDKCWIKISLAIFLVYSVSPFSVKIFNNKGVDDILNIIESEFGDDYLDLEKLENLYVEKPELEEVINGLVRKKFIEKPLDGKLFFSGNILKNVSLFNSRKNGD